MTSFSKKKKMKLTTFPTWISFKYFRKKRICSFVIIEISYIWHYIMDWQEGNLTITTIQNIFNRKDNMAEISSVKLSFIIVMILLVVSRSGKISSSSFFVCLFEC